MSAGTTLSTRPLAAGTTAEHALGHLRGLIIAGTLVPGQRIGQEDVADQLGISVAPVREALRVLEQEGQVTYRPRRGYFVTALSLDDLEEIYELRQLLEARALRKAMPTLDAEGLARATTAAADCTRAAEAGDVSAELEANRRFHLGLIDSPDQPHTMRIIRILWDSTEAYRALYYNSPEERRASAAAHERVLEAIRAGDVEQAIDELDAHRRRALAVLRVILADEGG
jgi:DNA-binding GntR family transcriptional regulator